MFGIPAVAYKYIYLLLVVLLSSVVIGKYKLVTDDCLATNGKKDSIGNVCLVIFLALFVGFRPLSGRYFVDMANYAESYIFLYEGRTFLFNPMAENLIFDNLFAWWGSLRLGYTFFFVFIAFIYFSASYLGIRRLFPEYKLIAYLVFLGAFSTFSYATNGIKAGAAASLFIWAMGYRSNLKICIPLILVSWGFHHSMQLPVYAFFLTLFFKNSKWYFYGWVFCLVMSMLHVGFFANLFGSMTDESGAGYIMGAGNGVQDGTKGGFRIDFILYSSMPVLVGYIATVKKKLQVSDLYRDLLNLYLCTNGVWMLCMYANFTNRIAYLSWFLYPIVLIYPFLNENWGSERYQTFSKVVLGHLAFTLFLLLLY